jgi:hypothetical protein
VLEYWGINKSEEEVVVACNRDPSWSILGEEATQYFLINIGPRNESGENRRELKFMTIKIVK